MTKNIWVPVGKTKVTISGGVITVWEEMDFLPQIASVPPTGFQKGEKS